jgi:hypothetical protein
MRDLYFNLDVLTSFDEWIWRIAFPAHHLEVTREAMDQPSH